MIASYRVSMARISSALSGAMPRSASPACSATCVCVSTSETSRLAWDRTWTYRGRSRGSGRGLSCVSWWLRVLSHVSEDVSKRDSLRAKVERDDHVVRGFHIGVIRSFDVDVDLRRPSMSSGSAFGESRKKAKRRAFSLPYLAIDAGRRS